MMQKMLLRINVILKLGVLNVLTVVLYKVLLKFSIHPVCRIKSEIPYGPYFVQNVKRDGYFLAPIHWVSHQMLFGRKGAAISDYPIEWFPNKPHFFDENGILQKWWKLSDFDRKTGDIKVIWEYSRFDWLVSFAQQVQVNQDLDRLSCLNSWLEDWHVANPPYQGPNWKCAQECSIRVIKLVTASIILGTIERPSENLLNSVKVHLKRILPTVHYAAAQNNNHIIGEAVAIFVAGSWLRYLEDESGAEFECQGRELLEKNANKLIASDGSFSQHSSNYHRLLIDYLSFAEVWRRKISANKFSENFYNKCRLAASWLYDFTCPKTGYSPNLGANDSAYLLNFFAADHRDNRPSIQLAISLFFNARAYGNSTIVNSTIIWLDEKIKETAFLPSNNQLYTQGGYIRLVQNDATAFLTYPNFRFRPSQADLLHIDLWVNGINVLRDGGTYSYYNTPSCGQYFEGTIAHNTIQFDDRDQMTRLSRFLFGGWPKSNVVEMSKSDEKTRRFGVSFEDHFGATHYREICLSQNHLEIRDEIFGFKKNAKLRFRLNDTNWKILEKGAASDSFKIEINATTSKKHLSFFEGMESLHYNSFVAAPILQLEVNEPCNIITTVSWV